MEWFNANVGSVNTPLEQAPEILKAVGMYSPVNVCLCVVDHLMGVLRAQPIVTSQIIAVQIRPSFHVAFNEGVQIFLFTLPDNSRAHFAATLQNGCYDGFAFRPRSLSLTAPAL